jgi:sialate O-acetylesterase
MSELRPSISRKLSLLALILIFVMGLAAPLTAEVKLNGVFGSGMVLQQKMSVPVWGTAAAGEKVTVEFAGQKKSATAGADGRWKVVLEPLTASSENRDFTVRGDGTAAPVVLNNVLVGEVWLCGGQSNMEWGVARSTDSEAIIAAGENPLLRMGRINHSDLPHGSPTPLDSFPVNWTAASPKTVKLYSAVPYLFGSGLQKALGVPVGIINNSYGGTRIESWLSAEVLKSGPWAQDKFADPVQARAEYDARKAKLQPQYDRYLEEKAKAAAEKRPEPPAVDGWPGNYRGPVVLWNGLLAPIRGFAMRGLVWNQGENNGSDDGDRYLQLLKALAKSYRSDWGQSDFPVIVMQLCTYKKPGGYAYIREAQMKFVQEDKNAALVVSLDQSAPDGDVHFPEKREVSARTVRAAMGLAYGSKDEFSGPIFDSVKFDGSRAIVSFTHLGGGLVAKDGALRHFEIAGADKKFVPAEAKIEGDTVVVSSPAVAQPAAVRYGFTQLPWPPVNLFSKAGLPASQFRSDSWQPEKK